jgi:hypothetical protein
MAGMVPAGGAVCHTGTYDGPAWGEVYAKQMNGSSFTEPLPWELTNTDYIRRLVFQVGYSLKPLVEATVKAQGKVEYAQRKNQKVFVWCPKNKKFEVAVETKWDHKKKKFNNNTNATFAAKLAAAKVVFESQNKQGEISSDAFMLMKHMLFSGNHACNISNIAEYTKLLGCTKPIPIGKQTIMDPLKTALDELMKTRNELAHMNLTSATRPWNIDELFTLAKYVVERAGAYLGHSPNYAEENMKRLETQWETHTKSKSRRQNALRLYVSNLPANATKPKLVAHLNAAMRAAGYCNSTVPGKPVISCSTSQNNAGDWYAFAELRSVQETDKCLDLTGLPFLRGTLDIKRPDQYLGPKKGASTWAQVASTINTASLDPATRAQLQAGGVIL